jgi:hypothetical protein
MMENPKLTLLARALLLVLALAGQSRAATFVSGIVSGTWTSASSPYIVTNNLTVPSGQTLTLQPGVTVIMGQGLSLDVAGTLAAVGTATEPITIQGPNSSLFWDEILVHYTPNAPSRFVNCVLSDATNAISLSINGVNATMTTEIANCTFVNIQGAAVRGVSLGAAHWTISCTQAIYEPNLETAVRNCLFTNCLFGCYFFAAGSSSFNERCSEGSAIAVAYAHPTIQNCVFQSIGASGAVLEAGPYSGASSAKIVNNIFTGCTNALVKANGSNFGCDASYNCFFQNATNFAGFTGGALGAICCQNARGTNCDLANNIFENPIFEGAIAYTLATNSPCIDAGSPDWAFADICFPPGQGSPTSDLGLGGGPYACNWLPAAMVPQFAFITNADTTLTLIYYNGPGGDVSIPDTTNGLPVTGIACNVFKNQSGFTSVTIGTNVTSIGSNAFYHCISLTNVAMPGRVASIEVGTFQFCTNLTGITIPDSVTNIGSFAFASCLKLTSLIIPNNVVRIGDSTFQDCTALTNTLVGTNVTSIGNSAFASCRSLTSFLIPNSVTSLGNNAFYFCTNLTSITIPNGVTTIGDSAFSSCRQLTNALIGNGVTRIGDSAFYYCASLNNLTIGDGVTSLGYSAFASCNSLRNVTIPRSVATISSNAFAYCFNLNNVALFGNATNIEDSAFYLCNSLTNIMIGDSVTNFESYAFKSITSLTAIAVDAANPAFCSVDGVLFNQDQSTLIVCPNGKAGSFTMPSSVTNIGTAAFYRCTKLTHITIGNKVTRIGNTDFEYCSRLTSVTIPDSVQMIEDGDQIVPTGDILGAFAYCSSLTNVTIGNGITQLGRRAFDNCINLTGVYFRGNAPGANFFNFSAATKALVYYVPGTAGWNPQVQTSDATFGVQTNRFGFPIIGTCGMAIVVQACTNLANPSWSSVATNTFTTWPLFPPGTNTTSSSYFSDSEWTNYPTRFYRLWGPAFGGRPAVLWNPRVQAGDPSFGVRSNSFGFTITGTTNIPVVIEGSTSLANSTWVPIQACILTNGSFYFRDPDSTNYPARFYRIRSP